MTNFNGNTVSVFLIDPASGMLSAISGSPFAAGAGPVSIAIDPTDAFAFVANKSDQTIASYALNATTGALDAGLRLTLSAGTNPEALIVDPSRQLRFRGQCSSPNQVATFTITPSQRRTDRVVDQPPRVLCRSPWRSILRGIFSMP